MTAATLDAAPAEEKSARRKNRPDDEPEDGITELEKFEPERVDGVGTPANGFPVLMMKGVPDESGAGPEDAAKADGDSGSPEDQDEAEDGDEDTAKEAAVRQAYDTARSEWMAREPLAKEALTGTEYLQQQTAWRRWYAEGDEAGLNGTSDGYALWAAKQAAPENPADSPQEEADPAPDLDAEVIKAEAAVYKRDIDTATRRKLAGEGHALPDGSYPIANSEDLHNAAVLARSGHGNAASAKRLIARRAQELGVANPLESDGKDTAKATMPGKKPPCKTCNGAGTIKDGNMRCPDCKGKGKMKMKPGAAKAGAALAAIHETVAKQVTDGVISQAAADAILAELAKERPLPADVKPVGEHREPDGTSTVEQLEPEAGLPADPDPVPDKVPSSVGAMGKDAPYAVARMHDATCAAYAADDVLAAYPALKGIADAISTDWWREQVQQAGETEKAAGLRQLAGAAALVKDADPDAVADGRAFLHKAFADMYPSEHCSPGMPPAPGKYQRPYLSAGHSAEDAGHNGSTAIPPARHVPEPEDYQRPLITAGHEADSPANGPANNRVAPGSPRAARSYYSNAARDQARTALAAMHDHIAGSFPDLCPMAASKTVLPPDLGAKNVPQPVTPASQGGVIKTDGDAAPVVIASGEAVVPQQIAGALGYTASNYGAGSLLVTEKSVRKMIRKALRDQPPATAPQAPPLDTEALRTLLSEQIASLTEKYDTQLTEIRKEIGELGSQPDPALAPLRGALARPLAAAVPVERRSLVDEMQAETMRKEAAERTAYRQYVEALAHSPDPGTREKALAVIEKMSAAA
jgi:hypothetical protein